MLILRQLLLTFNQIKIRNIFWLVTTLPLVRSKEIVGLTVCHSRDRADSVVIWLGGQLGASLQHVYLQSNVFETLPGLGGFYKNSLQDPYDIYNYSSNSCIPDPAAFQMSLCESPP